MSPNSFVWYELMTSDMAGAEAFYRSVLCWTAQPMGPPGVAYTVVSAGNAMVAGLMAIPEDVKAAGGRPMWFGYVGTPDVDAATAAIERDGGLVRRPPSDIPEIGRFSVVADPHGATFMLFAPKGGTGPARDPKTAGHVGWHELHASDGPSAFDFYSRQFGWTKDRAVDMGPMGTYQLFAAGGEAIGGMMTKFAARPTLGWEFYFTVAELDAAVGRVTADGGSVMNGPMEVPGGSWIANCTDPQGASFSLVSAAR